VHPEIQGGDVHMDGGIADVGASDVGGKVIADLPVLQPIMAGSFSRCGPVGLESLRAVRDLPSPRPALWCAAETHLCTATWHLGRKL
jgi:hypothetical protein